MQQRRPNPLVAPKQQPRTNLMAAPMQQRRPNLMAAPMQQPRTNLMAAPMQQRRPNLMAAPSARPRPTPVIKRYRRFTGYDYSRGASLFITITLARRFPAFGRVEGDHVALSPAGEALAETFRTELARHPSLAVRASVIMPDHLHFRITIAPNTPQPLTDLGRLIANVKRWAKWKAGKLGIDIDWQQGAHDRICASREINDTVDLYIGNNPLKWSLMHGPNPPLAVIEPFDSPRLPETEWWTAVGNAALFEEGRHVAAVRLSRRLASQDHAAVVRRCLDAARRGWVLASTFISPCEQALFKALGEAELPAIKAVPDALASVYRPKGGETAAFAAGRLLLLSRVAAPAMSRQDAWHGMNDALAEAARLHGKAFYVQPKAGGVDWRT